MRRRIAVYGASEAALALLPALARRRDLELVWIYDPEARALRRRLAWIEPGAARLLQEALTDDPRVPARAGGLALVIDGSLGPPAAPPAGAVPPETLAQLDQRKGEMAWGPRTPLLKLSVGSQSAERTRLRLAVKTYTPQRLTDWLASAGLTPTTLHRLRLGRVPLSTLAAGDWRVLGPHERF